MYNVPLRSTKLETTVQDRLAQHRLLVGAPPEQLAWLAARGQLVRLEQEEVLTSKVRPVRGLYIVLSGHMSIHIDRGAGPHKVMEWRGGDVTGLLPFSRLVAAPGEVKAEEPTELLDDPARGDPRADPRMPRTHRDLRARHARPRPPFHVERPSGGEDVLPRQARGRARARAEQPRLGGRPERQGLKAQLSEVEVASRALGAAHLSEAQQAAVGRSRNLCLAAAGTTFGRSPIEQADREDAIADWLSRHGADVTAAEALAESAVTIEPSTSSRGRSTARRSARRSRGSWPAARRTGWRRRSSGRVTKIHSLVAAVKGFTYMDQATMPKPVDVRQGLADTLAVLNAKARGKSVSVSLDADADLPRVPGFGGELNQVWANLVDNALDARQEPRRRGQRRRQGQTVVVRVVDDGPGLPAEIRERIFDPFFTTKPVGQGTGLGLDIARRIVRKHQGEIESTPAQGTHSSA